MLVKGYLEIDQNRGVVYFHSEKHDRTILRIQGISTPLNLPEGFFIDIRQPEKKDAPVKA